VVCVNDFLPLTAGWNGMEKSSFILNVSLVPRPLPDFISQPWRKIRRRPTGIMEPIAKARQIGL